MRRIWLIPVLVFLVAISAWAQMGIDNPQPTDSKQAFMSGSLVVKGEGAAPVFRDESAASKRIMALRAAKVMALREISEILDGVSINGDTTISSASAKSDNVRTTVQGIIKGAQVLKESYDPVAESAVVFVTVPLTGPNGVMGLLLPKIMPSMPEMTPFQPAQAVQGAGNYDSLIVDASGLPFKPALINRILTKNGEVIYDPAKVPLNIITDKGAAEYTDDVVKAKALLADRGANNPLVVKASGLANSTDVELSIDDANAVFASNQTNNYLEGAKVVFVLK